MSDVFLRSLSHDFDGLFERDVDGITDDDALRVLAAAETSNDWAPGLPGLVSRRRELKTPPRNDWR